MFQMREWEQQCHNGCRAIDEASCEPAPELPRVAPPNARARRHRNELRMSPGVTVHINAFNRPNNGHQNQSILTEYTWLPRALTVT